MNIIELQGCAPQPLASYLKAIAVFRIIAEQFDRSVRAWWDGESFKISTQKTEQEIIEFFAESWAPTPIIGPWGKGSGFLGTTQDPVIKAIESSEAARFAALREGVAAAQAKLAELGEADRAVRRIKEETKSKTLSSAAKAALKSSEDYKARLAAADRRFNQLKRGMIPRLRRDWRGRHREWLDAALVVGADGSVKYPSLLGTGGNDGRLDFTLKYLQIVSDVFDLKSPDGHSKEGVRALIASSLFNIPTRGTLHDWPVGQFSPAAAGGANASNGPAAEGAANPFDVLLFLEGSVPFRSASVRRYENESGARVAAPFALSTQAFGYASASNSDEAARGEQWMPLWGNPTLLGDFQRLLAEGRAEVGGSKSREPLDLARAAARLGVARGIQSFQRYGYFERNGQSNFAVPLSRVEVHSESVGGLYALDDIEAWLKKMRRVARDKGAPGRLAVAEHALADAVFALVSRVDEPSRWQAVLLAMADIEELQVRRSGRKAGAIPLLRPEWAVHADDGSAEFRLALAFALQPDVRRHWLSRDQGTFVDGRADRVMQGRRGVDDAIAVVERRMVEGSQHGTRSFPLAGRLAFAAPSDLELLLAGRVDLDRCLRLSCSLMALDQRAWRRARPQLSNAPRNGVPEEAWLALRVSLLPQRLPDGRAPRTDPAVVRRLVAGDAAGAVEVARRRLQAAGIVCGFTTATATPERARLFAAALAFPIAPETAQNFANRLDPATGTAQRTTEKTK